MGIFEFNNFPDRQSAKIFYGIVLKHFHMCFHVCMQKHMVPSINKYTLIGDMLKFF